MPSVSALTFVALAPVVGANTSGSMLGNGQVVVENERIRVLIEFGSWGLRETYYALGSGEPVLVARGADAGATFLGATADTGDRSRVASDYATIGEEVISGRLKLEDIPPELQPQPPLPGCAVTYAAPTLERQPDGAQKLTLTGRTPEGDRIERVLTLAPGEDFLRTEVRLDISRALLVERFEDRLHFLPEGRPDFTWAPHLKMDEDTVFPDWTLKAPAAIVQKGRAAVSLIPDVEDLARDDVWRRCNLTLDLDVRPVPGPRLSYGLCPTSMMRFHTVYPHVPGQSVALDPGTYRFSYFLLIADDVPERQAHRRVVRFLWDRFGHRAFLEGHAAQKETFDAWRKQTWHENLQEMWRDVDRNGVPCGMITRWNTTDFDGHFCAWWNNMRTAYGLALYARRAGDAQARDRAGRILNLVLDAPRDQGAFPIFFTVHGQDGPRWRRDHDFGGLIDCYHAYDMAWTAYWMLRWRSDIDPADPRILAPCVALGDFLLKHQSASGFIPSYFKEDFSLQEDCGLNSISAEPAACAVFLAELHRATADPKYLEGAVKAVEYVYREIVPERKWFDFETFLSCSPKAYDFYDPITAQYPQNNMATIQMAMACGMLHAITNDRRFLEWGEDVLDQLSLTQQVWSHPRMTPNLIGGFTTQNSDSEWSDARQAYCAPVYLDFFERTGRFEYLERGIAALRASFAVAPYENWAHLGLCDTPGAFSGLNWGQASAMATVEMLSDRYGDALADLKQGWAYGVNGCTVEACRLDANVIRMDVRTELEWSGPARFVFRNVPEGPLSLVVNGHECGSFGRDDLERGVEVPLARS